jgi:hypothetical protein
LTFRRCAALVLVAGALLTGCGDGDKDKNASGGVPPLGGTPESAPPSPGGPIPTVTPPSPEPSSDIVKDLPPAATPGPGPTPCPADGQIVTTYQQYLKGLGVTPPAYTLVKRSSCAAGWAAASLREGPDGPPFVVVVGPNIGGKKLSVVADGTDRDKGGPCDVAARSKAPAPVLSFCRSAQ